MIAKIKTGQYFKGAFLYNLKKVSEGKASFFYNSLFKTENPSFDEMISEFKEMSSLCPNVSKPVFHTSINFSPDEFLDDDTLQAVVDDYMQKLGYGNTPYAVFKHTDTNHQHVHIISTNIQNVNGKYKKIPDNFIHLRSEAIDRVLEKEYGLIVATEVKKERKKQAELLPELKEYGKVSTYQQLQDVTGYIMANCKFTNLYEFNGLLNKYNIACFRNISKSGKMYYRFTFQDVRNRTNLGVGGTPKQLKLDFTSEDLDNIFTANKKERKAVLSGIDDIKKDLLADYLFISENDFNKYLHKKGILKIDDNRYLFQESKTILTRKDLKIPEKFITDTTLKREYFSNIVKSATEYRKTIGIFHESTMYSSPEYVKGFQNYFEHQDTHLTGRQKELLFHSFSNYKQNNLNKIMEKEYEKDCQLVNKMFGYVSMLNLSEETASLFLEKFNIYTDGNNTIRVGNTVDQVIHQVNKSDVMIYHPEGKDYTSLLNKMNDAELSLIKNAVNDKPCILSKEIEWERVSPFIPATYAEQYNIEECLTEQEYQLQTDYSEVQGVALNIFNSKNEYEYMPGKKKKKHDDEEDEESKKKKKRRKK